MNGWEAMVSELRKSFSIIRQDYFCSNTGCNLASEAVFLILDEWRRFSCLENLEEITLSPTYPLTKNPVVTEEILSFIRSSLYVLLMT